MLLPYIRPLIDLQCLKCFRLMMGRTLPTSRAPHGPATIAHLPIAVAVPLCLTDKHSQMPKCVSFAWCVCLPSFLEILYAHTSVFE